MSETMIFLSTNGKISRLMPAFSLFLAETPDLAGDFPAYACRTSFIKELGGEIPLRLSCCLFCSAVWGIADTLEGGKGG
ncbi:hypothetical protein G5B47_08845 [Paenibacillus sp. 7124]|uniref:Uncharacterized protein n=1 Tax=Paenibacillus apii TaxID=1850370 RepID=A0A6M1PIX9_9BACL|nr:MULTISPECIES: hypothetical protein [Paenibacillus]NGM82524.1 hypothetical protein [Paenibacillus apii]